MGVYKPSCARGRQRCASKRLPRQEPGGAACRRRSADGEQAERLSHGNSMGLRD